MLAFINRYFTFYCLNEIMFGKDEYKKQFKRKKMSLEDDQNKKLKCSKIDIKFLSFCKANFTNTFGEKSLKTLRFLIEKGLNCLFLN